MDRMKKDSFKKQQLMPGADGFGKQFNTNFTISTSFCPNLKTIESNLSTKSSQSTTLAGASLVSNLNTFASISSSNKPFGKQPHI